MAFEYHQSLYKPLHPAKYKGDPTRIVCRSSWERRFCHYVDTTPGILAWSSEEFFIPYIKPTDGQTHRYYPDFYLEVQAVGGVIKYVVEIKPKKDITFSGVPKSRRVRQSRKFITEAITYAVNAAKWEAAKKYCAARGWKFIVLTEDHLFMGKHG
jgi:hypothetical protein